METPGIEKQDRRVLQELAKPIRDIASQPVQEDRRTLWRKINQLEPCRIPVLVRVNDLYWDEVVPPHALQCSTPLARDYERQLRLKIWLWENVDDDRVTEPMIGYETHIRYPQLISPQKVGPDTETLGAYHVQPVIETESDIDKIIIDTECRVDWDETARRREWVEGIFGGILTPVRMHSVGGISPFDYVCEIRGMDNVFMDMCERPEWIEEIMRRLYQLHMDIATQMEKAGALTLNEAFRVAYNGGFGYTNELPAEGFDPDHVRLKDIWGFTAAQSSVSISPDMHERFITQFDREYHRLFGRTAIACCETVDRKMPLYRTLPHLRRISICAWNDFERAAREIGMDYIYSIKPSAVSISRPTWRVEEDMAYLADILDQSQGCRIEIVHHEIATCHGHPERLTQWAKHAKRLATQRSGG
jgi:hypothetical protein